MISLVAYADRAGDVMYNDILVKSRVDAEANVPVPTAGDVPRQGNTVVMVTFEDGM